MPAPPNFPIDATAVETAIQRLRTLDLTATSIDEIKDLLEPALEGHMAWAPEFEPGVSLFRARIMGKPTWVNQCSYPPACRVSIGRANRAGCPVLYCALSKETALFEVRPQPGDSLAICEWQTRVQMNVNHIGYSPAVFARLGSVRTHPSWMSLPVTIPGGEDNLKIQEFLAETFTFDAVLGQEHRYKLSVAIAEKFLINSPFDGLLYPTMQMRANADNIALLPTFADTNLAFRRCVFLCVDSVDVVESEIMTRVLDTADSAEPDGRINWSGQVSAWALGATKSIVKRYNGTRWVGFDEDGHPVDD